VSRKVWLISGVNIPGGRGSLLRADPIRILPRPEAVVDEGKWPFRHSGLGGVNKATAKPQAFGATLTQEGG